jgi:hypothetical protein
MPETVAVSVSDAYEAAAIESLNTLNVRPFTDDELRAAFTRLCPRNTPATWPAGPYLDILRLLATLRDRGVIRFDLLGDGHA